MRFIYALALSLVTPLLAAAEPANVPSLENLAKREEVSDVVLSPDGKTIAAISPQGDYGTLLLFIDTATVKATNGFQDSGLRTPATLEWLNNDRIAVGTALKYGGFAVPQLTGELIGTNRDGSGIELLYGSRGAMQTGTMLKTRAGDTGFAQIAAALVDDPKFSLITVRKFGPNGSHTELHRMHKVTGRHQSIAVAPIRNGQFLLDHTGQPRFAVGESTDGEIKLFRKDAEWVLVYETAKNDGDLIPLQFARDNKSFYAYWYPRKGPASVVRVDAQSMQRTNVYVPKFASPLGVYATADRKDIYAVRTAEGPTQLQIIDEKAPEAKIWRALSKSFPKQFLRPIGYSTDGGTALFKVSASNNSGDYYLFNAKTREAKFLFSEHSWLDAEQMAQTEPFSLKARDGLQLHGYLTLPNKVAGKNLPMVVMPHGGPHGERDDDQFDPWVQALASRGYAVLKVNFRGSGGYGVDFELAGYQQWGRAMQDDLTDATRWAIEQGFADEKRIAIVGASYGGYAALMGAARESELYRAAISYVGVTDLELMFSRGDIEDSAWGRSYLKRTLGTDPAEHKQRSPVNLAEQIEAPVLLIYGGQDERVPAVHGRRMRDALKAAGKTVEYFEVSDEMHGFYKHANVVEGYQRMLRFLDTHLSQTSNTAAATQP